MAIRKRKPATAPRNPDVIKIKRTFHGFGHSTAHDLLFEAIELGRPAANHQIRCQRGMTDRTETGHEVFKLLPDNCLTITDTDLSVMTIMTFKLPNDHREFEGVDGTGEQKTTLGYHTQNGGPHPVQDGYRMRDTYREQLYYVDRSAFIRVFTPGPGGIGKVLHKVIRHNHKREYPVSIPKNAKPTQVDREARKRIIPGRPYADVFTHTVIEESQIPRTAHRNDMMLDDFERKLRATELVPFDSFWKSPPGPQPLPPVSNDEFLQQLVQGCMEKAAELRSGAARASDYEAAPSTSGTATAGQGEEQPAGLLTPSPASAPAQPCSALASTTAPTSGIRQGRPLVRSPVPVPSHSTQSQGQGHGQGQVAVRRGNTCSPSPAEADTRLRERDLRLPVSAVRAGAAATSPSSVPPLKTKVQRIGALGGELVPQTPAEKEAQAELLTRAVLARQGLQLPSDPALLAAVGLASASASKPTKLTASGPGRRWPGGTPVGALHRAQASPAAQLSSAEEEHFKLHRTLGDSSVLPDLDTYGSVNGFWSGGLLQDSGGALHT